jgi:transposase
MDSIHTRKEKLKRKNEIKFLFNDLENEAFDKFCKKYKIKNKSKFIRESVMREVLGRFDKDYPSLFDSLDE